MIRKVLTDLVHCMATLFTIILLTIGIVLLWKMLLFSIRV